MPVRLNIILVPMLTTMDTPSVIMNMKGSTSESVVKKSMMNMMGTAIMTYFHISPRVVLNMAFMTSVIPPVSIS